MVFWKIEKHKKDILKWSDLYNLSQNLGLLAQKMEEDCGSAPSSYSAKNKSWLPGLRKKKSGQNSNTM